MEAARDHIMWLWQSVAAAGIVDMGPSYNLHYIIFSVILPLEC